MNIYKILIYLFILTLLPLFVFADSSSENPAKTKKPCGFPDDMNCFENKQVADAEMVNANFKVLLDKINQLEERLTEFESNQWYDMITPEGWTNYDAKCRVFNGWIEFRGKYDHPPISGWGTNIILLLPEECRPKSSRFTEMPCHAESPPRNSVCNNDFGTDGYVWIYTDFPVTQQRFEGVRVWKGN